MSQPRAMRRLQKELRTIEELQSGGDDLGWSAGLIEDNIYEWEGFLFGPADSSYEGGVFQFTITFGTEYPIKPPHIKFVNVPFHPNVYRSGEICLDILQNQWTPALQINTLLQSLRSLLTDPNINSPANSEAARLYRDDRAAYDAKVRAMVATGGVGNSVSNSTQIDNYNDSDDDY